MKKIFLPCIFLASAAFIPVPPAADTRYQPIDHPEFSRSQNQFAFRFMKAAWEEDTSNSNKLVSPMSLYFALSILYNGAGHATRDSIGEMLQATGIGAMNLGGMCKQLLMQLPGEDQAVQLALANSIWSNRKRTMLQPAFATLAEDLYYTPVQSLDFSSRAAAARINSWVDQNSFHRITHLVQRTNPRDLMCLINVLYFKSKWSVPFELYHTRKASFFREDGSVTKIPFMNRNGGIRTFSDTGFTLVELPYGGGKSYSMYVIMPEDMLRPLHEFAVAFTADRLDFALSHMTSQSIDLFLPRWHCEYSVDHCTEALSRMGIGIAFDSRNADFSNMYKAQPNNEGGGCLSRVIHKTFIDVNENGTEAAAATDPSMTFGMIRFPRPPRIIRADHPFMYMIVEKQQNLVLFTGLVNDPAP